MGPMSVAAQDVEGLAGNAPELSAAQESGFCTMYQTLPKKPASLVRLFDRNGFYSVHGPEDVELACKEVYHTESVIRYLGASRAAGLASVTLNKKTVETFLQICLFSKGLKIEIWELNKASKRWECQRRASPGYVLEVSELLPSADIGGAILAALQISRRDDQRVVGLCFANPDRRELGFDEFLDDETYANVEAMMIQLQVQECILQQEQSTNRLDLLALRRLMERCNITVTEHNAIKQSDAGLDDLERLVEDSQALHKLSLSESKLALNASSNLIHFLSLLEREENCKTWTLSAFRTSHFMRLDSSALKALSLETEGGTTAANESTSLPRVLDKCKTPAGSRLLSQWLRQPLTDLSQIEERHDLVGLFIDQSAVSVELRDELKLVPDLSRLSRKFRRATAGLEDVVRCYQFAVRLPTLIDSLQSISTEQAGFDLLQKVFLLPLREHDTILQKLRDLVETTVDLEALNRHEFLIRHDFDNNLAAIRAKLDSTTRDIDEEHRRLSVVLNLDAEKKLKVECHSTFGYCLRLTRLEASVLRNRKEYRELQTAKAGVYFTTPTMSSLATAYSELTSQYSRHQTALVREVVQIAASYSPILERVGQNLAQLDILLSFASVSLHAPTPYVKPVMKAVGTGDVILLDSRHPCLEAQNQHAIIPNDLRLIRGQSEFIIITGANMGGKSTYIRQIGVIALMAQIGCWVPCASAHLTIFDAILARVGAGDSQLKGVSTFMAEMLETSAIMQAATRNSLVIIDELGRGTSTTDGYGLAYGISEHLVKHIGCFTLFATHFHELTRLAEQHNVIQNCHVSIHMDPEGSEGITLLYKIKPGSCSKSFGIHVAELAHFPLQVVAMAKRKLEELEHDTERQGERSPSRSLWTISRLKELSARMNSVRQGQSADSVQFLNTFRNTVREITGRDVD